jgi:outer membrane protein
MFSARFGAELALGASRHRLSAVGPSTCCGGGDRALDAGHVWLLPATVLVQYHQPVYGPWDPYVGVGVGWTVPIESSASELGEAGVTRLDLEGSPGVALQIGANYDRDDRWYFNVDLRYLGTTLEARVRLEDGDAPPVDLDIKPWQIALGLGYRF